MTEAVFKPIQLRIIALMIIMPYCMMAYPVFGMKRYGRSSSHPQNGWAMSSVMHRPSYYYQALPRPQTYHPFSYYDALNLYAPEYDDYYYSQDAMAYPLYYPTFSRGGSNNYDFYQPVVPYYYTNPYSYYDSSDPMEDLQEEVLQEEEREQREEGYPIGQETWYEPDGTESQDTDSMDDVNAAFMKNLMLYNKAMTHPNYVYGKIQPEDAYSQYTDLDNWNTNPYNYEDKDEQELKMLNEAPKKQKSKNNKKQSTAEERMQMFEKNNNRNQKNRYNPNNSESWMNYGNKRTSRPDGGVKTIKYDTSFTSRKPQKVMTINKVSSSSTVSPVSTQTAFNDPRGGQKEVVMIRPATPVRRPFSEPVMQLLAKQGGPERKRTPSVYDTIKHMLEMEKNLEKEYRTQDYFRPAMRKRYVSSEESLVEELSGLKKTA